jgi:hypothetical protein
MMNFSLHFNLFLHEIVFPIRVTVLIARGHDVFFRVPVVIGVISLVCQLLSLSRNPSLLVCL